MSNWISALLFEVRDTLQKLEGGNPDTSMNNGASPREHCLQGNHETGRLLPPCLLAESRRVKAQVRIYLAQRQGLAMQP